MEIRTNYVLREVVWNVTNLIFRCQISPHATGERFTIKKRLSAESLERRFFWKEEGCSSLGGLRSVESGSVLSLLSDEAGVRGGVR